MEDWSFSADRRPAMAFVHPQPEKTPRGDVYTWVVTFRSVEIDPQQRDVPCYTQMAIREWSGDLITTHGRIYSPPEKDEDGA